MAFTSISSWALLLWKALQANGEDADAAFRRAGLDPAKLQDPTARYSVTGMARLWQIAVQDTGDPCFGILVAQFWHPTTGHALGYALMAGASLKETVGRLSRYVRVVSDASGLALSHEGGVSRLSFEMRSPQVSKTPAAIDAALGAVLQMCRQCAGSGFNPLRVSVTHERPTCTDRLDAFFCAPIEYGAAENALIFDTAAIESPLPTANRELAESSMEIVRGYLASLDRENLSPRVREEIVRALASGEPQAGEIAGRMNMSVRNLQRKLRKEQTSFQKLLDDTRRELASRYVANPRISISEITYLLGFAEPASFTRAFRRWTGKTPSAQREAQADTLN